MIQTFSYPGRDAETAISPFSAGREGQPENERESILVAQGGAELQAMPEIDEGNRERSLRRAANACEVAAGASGSTAVIFVFTALNVPPVGIMLTLGVTHLYLTATVAGEGRERWVVNLITATSTGSAAIAATAEPIGEWLEASQTRSSALRVHKQTYNPPRPLGSRLGADIDLGGIGALELSGGLLVAFILMLLTRR